jgi:membrane-bound lytic murein transglycosylase B
VLDGLPRELRSVVRHTVASRREFRSMHTDLADTLPAWRIVPPAPEEQLLRFYKRGERAYGIGWEYLAAINLVETGMGRIRGTSVAGAQGPMQFLPSTWARWGRGDIQDPGDAIMAAARYLAHDGGARPGRIDEALFRYNNSTAYVRGVTHLAEVMERRPRAFYGYYHWEIYYLTSRGDVRLPVGYDHDGPVPVRTWLANHPEG